MRTAYIFSTLSGVLVFCLLLPTALWSQELKFSPPAGPLQVDPDQIPYLELNQQGFSYLNKEWNQGYYEAVLVDTSGKKYTGQLFYLTDTSVVLYTTKTMFVPEIFETHHMEMQAQMIDQIRVRWRQSFRLGMQEGALFATGMGAVGSLILLLNPPTVALAPFGIFFGMLAAIPTGLQWGLFRYVVPIYKKINIQGDSTLYARNIPQLKKYVLFPYYWPPSVTEKLLEATPLAAKVLWRPTEEMFPLRISEVSMSLSPLMFEVFREKFGHSGFSLGLQFDGIRRQMLDHLDQAGYFNFSGLNTRGMAAFDTEIQIAPKFQIGLTGNASFARNINTSVEANEENLNVQSRRYNVQLGIDYVPVSQDRLMSVNSTWGAGLGLSGHSLSWVWNWSARDPATGQLDSQFITQRDIQPGAFGHLWIERYLGKDTSVRLWGKYHAALPFQFSNLLFQAHGNVERAIPAFTNTLLYGELGVSMRWHW